MPINPWWRKQLALIADIDSYEELMADPAAAARFQAYSAPAEPYALPELDITEVTAPGPHGAVPIRIYRPVGSAEREESLPGLLWAHGGGFRGGDLEMNEANVVSAELAARAGAVVVSVDYRLAVDGVRYPVPLDDVSAAWAWFVGAAVGLGIDPGRCSLGGASAGSNLATAVAARLRDVADPAALPHALLLAYPVVHFPVPALTQSVAQEMAQLPTMLRFHASTNEQMFGNYVGRVSALPGEVSPGSQDLTGFPTTRVVVSEYDDLRSSGELLVRQLRESGVAVESYLAEGMLHGHLNRTPAAALPPVGESLDFLAAAL